MPEKISSHQRKLQSVKKTIAEIENDGVGFSYPLSKLESLADKDKNFFDYWYKVCALAVCNSAWRYNYDNCNKDEKRKVNAADLVKNKTKKRLNIS